MKKAIGVLAAAMLAVSVSQAALQEWSESFEGSASGWTNRWDASHNWGDWSATESGGGTVPDGSRALLYAGRGSYAERSIGDASEKFEVAFQVRVSNARNGEGDDLLSIEDLTGKDLAAIHIENYDANLAQVHFYSTEGATEIRTFPKGDDYVNLKLRIDPTGGTVAWYFNDRLVASGIALRESGAGNAAILELKHYGGGGFRSNIDNIRVSSGARSALAAAREIDPRFDGNLAENPSFKEGGTAAIPGWDVVAGPWEIDIDAGSSLVCRLVEPAKSVGLFQEFKVVEGRRYEFSSMIKVNELRGKGSGATINLEYYDSEGKNLRFRDSRNRPKNYENPYGNKGTIGWERIGGVSRPVPKEARTARVILRVTKGLTGTAWFDDVVVKRHYLMSVVVTQPNYRGWIWADQNEVSFDVEFDAGEFGEIEGRFIVKSEISDSSGQVVASRSIQPAAAHFEESMELPANMAPGKYLFRIRLVESSSGQVFTEYTKELIRQEKGFKPESHIDRDNVLRVAGKPFFPLGCYYRKELINEKVLSSFDGTPFNTIMPYGGPDKAQMDMIAKHNLKVLYDVKSIYVGVGYPGVESKLDERPLLEGFVEQFKNHPALLGWYLNDERPIGQTYRMEAHYDWICELDPNHPAWSVFVYPEYYNFRRMVDLSDTFGTDPYPVPKHSLSMVSDWHHIVDSAFNGSRPNWGVVQIHTLADERSMTFEEINAMTWQAITQNCKGLVYYAFHWIHPDGRKLLKPWGLDTIELDPDFDTQWGWLCSVASEVAKWEEVILSEEAAPQITVKGEGVSYICKALNGKRYLFIVNSDYSEQEILIESDYKLVAKKPEFAVSKTGGTTYTVELPGLAVAIYSY